MSARQVEEIMGPPLWRIADNWKAPGNLEDEVWYYTRAGKPFGNYWSRKVWFRDGKVYKIDASFLVD